MLRCNLSNFEKRDLLKTQYLLFKTVFNHAGSIHAGPSAGVMRADKGLPHFEEFISVMECWSVRVVFSGCWRSENAQH